MWRPLIVVNGYACERRVGIHAYFTDADSVLREHEDSSEQHAGYGLRDRVSLETSCTF